jgi:hypothetical protein
MVPHGPYMGYHMAPLCGVNFWLEFTGVERMTSRASGNMLAQVELPTLLPYVCQPICCKHVFKFAILYGWAESASGLSPSPWSYHLPNEHSTKPSMGEPTDASPRTLVIAL